MHPKRPARVPYPPLPCLALLETHVILAPLFFQSDGKTYEDVCARQLDGTCELPFRGVTRFWGTERANYDVRRVLTGGEKGGVHARCCPFFVREHTGVLVG